MLISFVGCSSQHNFLDNFSELDEMPTTKSLRKFKVNINDTIPPSVLTTVFLVEANEVSYSNTFNKNKYFYLCKFKINSDFYLITYRKFTHPHEMTTVLAIYDVAKQCITSKLILESALEVNRTTDYKNGIFYIKTIYNRIPNGLDPKPNEEFITKEFIEKYQISNKFAFEKVD